METVDSWKAKGNEFMKSRQYDKAVECYSNGIKLDENNHILYSNRSAAYLAAGKVDEAYDDGVKCIALNPTWAKGYCRKGAAEQARMELEEAASTYKEGTRLSRSTRNN